MSVKKKYSPLLFFKTVYFIFSLIARNCIITGRFLWQSYHTQERTMHLLKEEASAVSSQKTLELSPTFKYHLWPLFKVFLPKFPVRTSSLLKLSGKLTRSRWTPDVEVKKTARTIK